MKEFIWDVLFPISSICIGILFFVFALILSLFSEEFVKKDNRNNINNYTITEDKLTNTIKIKVNKVPMTIILYDNENNVIEEVIIQLKESCDEYAI